MRQKKENRFLERMDDRFVTGRDRFVTAFEKYEISKRLGKSRLCGYGCDRYDRNDSFFSLSHVRAHTLISFFLIISVISVMEEKKKRKKARKIKDLWGDRQKGKAVMKLSQTCHDLSQILFWQKKGGQNE